MTKESDPSQQHPTREHFPLQILQILQPLAMINLDGLVDIVTFIFADDKFLEAGHFAPVCI